MKKKAVVLFNLGGPLSEEGIRPFLFNLFYDPAILDVPNPFRYVLAQLLTTKRLNKAQEIYAHMGGSSPLFRHTLAQARALEEELGPDYRAFVAMRYAPPFISETVEDVKAYDPDEIILLPLYPHFSKTTTGSSLGEWKRVTKGLGIPTRFIDFYPIEDGFLSAMKDLTLPHYKKAQKKGTPRLLLTAHGLPEKIIRKGDPYQTQVEQTAKHFLEKLSIPSVDSILCYQSRLGPLKWIGPFLEEEVYKAAQEKRPLVIVPVSFVSEHSETLVELDIIYKELALQEGCPSYHRVGTVQTHPLFIKGLANLVKGETKWFQSII